MPGKLSEDKRGGGLTLLLNAMGAEKETLYDVIYDDDGTYGDRDALGRITRKTEWIVSGDEPGTTPRALDARTYDYGYNAEGRPWLESVAVNDNVVSSYGYDENGNRTSVELNWSQLGYSTEFDISLDETETDYNQADQLLTYGTKSYAWNNFGQLESMHDSATDETTHYEYDLFGNLLSVALPDGRTIEYDVDGAGRRIGRRELDANGNEISFRGWIYRDLLRPIAEVNALGEVVARYVYSDGDGARQNGAWQLFTRLGGSADLNVPDFVRSVPDVMLNLNSGASFRLIKDQVGSVLMVVDTATGEVVQRTEYSAFGTVLRASGSNQQPFAYAGGLLDPSTGLARHGAREFLANVGRWLARDPIRFTAGDQNIYQYSFGEPINNWDATGLQVYKCSRWGNGSASYAKHGYTCVRTGGRTTCFGHGGDREDDVYDPENCEEIEDGSSCMDMCVEYELEYGQTDPYNPFTNNCYQDRGRRLDKCRAQCSRPVRQGTPVP